MSMQKTGFKYTKKSIEFKVSELVKRQQKWIFLSSLICAFNFAAEAQITVKPPQMPTAPKIEAPKVEPPKIEAPKVQPPKVEVPKVEAPKINAPKLEAPKMPDKKQLLNEASKQVTNSAQIRISNDFATKIASVLQDKTTDANGTQLSKGNLHVECTRGSKDANATCIFKPMK